MEIWLPILALAVFALAVAVFVQRRPATDPAADLQALRAQLAETLHTQTQMVSGQLQQLSAQMLSSQKTVGDRLDNAARVVGEVREGLGRIGEASLRILEVGKDIAGLGELLRSPKMRGGLGEYFLEDLLGQVLPARHFSVQHAFKTGHTVDAVVRIGDRMVPVDAKFPLENFRRLTAAAPEEDRRALRRKFAVDVKKHIDAVASKYILPDEGTYDFALMYIPAENVYYECIIKPDAPGEEAAIFEYALQKRVIPVSPASFYAYLQALVLGLKGLRIEENARELLENLSRLEGDFRRFAEDFDLAGRHLANAKAKHDEAGRRLERFQDKLSTASGASSPVESLPLR